MHLIDMMRIQYHYIRSYSILLQQNRRTAEQQNSRTTEQQNNRTTEQQNRRTAEQQNSRTTDKRFGVIKKISSFNLFFPFITKEFDL